jgi:cell division protein FtsB
MYEGDGSFTSGASSNNNQEEQVDVSTFRHEVEDDAAVMDLVAPPPYPPPTAGSGSFPPPPVSIVETSTADWGMMVVDRTSNGQDYANTNNHVEDDDDDEEDDYELVQGGALILDGVSSTNGEDHEEDPDASLSVPDSDNIPSDPGTIHGAPGGGGESANHSRATGNWEHLISDDEEGEDEDDEERHGNATRGRRYRGRMTLKAIFSRFYHFVICAGQSIIAPFEGAATTEDASSTASTMEATSFPQFVRTNGFSLLLVTMAVFFIPGYSYYQMAKSARNYEARWMQLQEENARLQQQEEHLRKEMEMLEEEAIAAMAKATSLYQELEKSKVLHAASGGPTTGGNKDFYFDEDCDKDSFTDDRDKDSFTVLDNCWIKVKTNVRLGDCGDDTKDFFKDLWSTFWNLHKYWGTEGFGGYDFEHAQDYEPYTSSLCSPSDSDDACREKEKKRMEDYFSGKEDPLTTAFSAVQSYVQSLSERMSQLMRHEMDNTQKAATKLEDAMQKGFTEASEAIYDAMATTKKDMHALSLEVMTMLNAAIPMNNPSSSKTQDDHQAQENESTSNPESGTSKGFFDTTSALSYLSKAWKETLAYMAATSPPGQDERN